MLTFKKSIIFLVCTSVLLFISGCGFNVENNEESGSGTSGTMPAGQEAPEVTGIVKNMDSAEEVVIEVGGQDKTFRLSEDAKGQVEAEEVSVGSEVTFTTYSIGDSTETIDRFQNN